MSSASWSPWSETHIGLEARPAQPYHQLSRGPAWRTLMRAPAAEAGTVTLQGA